MTTVTITAADLQPGDVLALPFGYTATVTDVKVGTKFVNLRLAEYPKTRVGRYDTVQVERPTPCECGEPDCDCASEAHHDGGLQ